MAGKITDKGVVDLPLTSTSSYHVSLTAAMFAGTVTLQTERVKTRGWLEGKVDRTR